MSSVSWLPIAEGHGFVGQTVRCRIEYDIDEEGAPKSLIVKMPSSDPARRKVFEQFGLYTREAGFYRELAADSRGFFPLPNCYFVGHDARGNFLLVLEDLSRARTVDRLKGLTVEQASEALDAVSRLHAGWWQDVRLTDQRWLPEADHEPLNGLVRDKYAEVWAAFERRYGHEVPSSLVRLGRVLRRSLGAVLSRLSRPPVTLVHGDYQLGNIFYLPDGSIGGVIDWQVCTRGRGAMDVAHLLARSLRPEDRRRVEADLLAHYHSALVRNGVRDYTLDECWRDYRLAIIAEFGVGVLSSAMLAETAVAGRDDDPELAAVSVVGAERFFAAVLDVEWEKLLKSLTPKSVSLGDKLKAALRPRAMLV